MNRLAVALRMYNWPNRFQCNYFLIFPRGSLIFYCFLESLYVCFSDCSSESHYHFVSRFPAVWYNAYLYWMWHISENHHYEEFLFEASLRQSERLYYQFRIRLQTCRRKYWNAITIDSLSVHKDRNKKCHLQQRCLFIQ